MRAVVATVALSATLLGCYPHSAKKRTYAQLIEGGSIAAGIGMNFIINSGADCDQMAGTVNPDSGCRTKATVLGDIGFGLILGGLVGFIATISTAQDDKEGATPTAIPSETTTTEKPVLKLPPGVKGNGASVGSAH